MAVMRFAPLCPRLLTMDAAVPEAVPAAISFNAAAMLSASEAGSSAL